MKTILTDFCKSIKDYEAESGHRICDVDDDRDAIEFVELFLNKYKLEWLPYEEDDDMDQEYWVLLSDMVGVSKCEYTNNGKPVTKWGSGNPVLKKTYGDIAPKPEDFEE